MYNINGDLMKCEDVKCLESIVPYFKEKYLPQVYEKYHTFGNENSSKE